MAAHIRKAALLAGALIAIALLHACGPEAVPSRHDASESSSHPILTPDPFAASALLTCGGQPFRSALLTGPGGSEDVDEAPNRALRAYLDSADPDARSLPARGWRVLIDTPGWVMFGAPHPSDWPAKIVVVSVTQSGITWRATSGGECSLETWLGDARAASWRVDPAGGDPDTSGVLLELLVRERTCATGRPATGRIAEPWVKYSDDSVTISIGVYPLSGAQTCPGNPETRYSLRLKEQLGGRVLLDGGVFPPAAVPSLAP